jgi:oligogalacturonide lyase
MPNFIMPGLIHHLTIVLALCACSLDVFAADTPPVEWIDPDTGHRVVRLSSEPGSESLYFNQNAWTAGGDKLVITSPQGISTLDFKTHQTELIVPGSKNLSGIVVGPKSRQIYYVRHTSDGLVAFLTQMDTRVTREIGKVPGGGFLMTVNADETLLAGSFAETNGSFQQMPGEKKGTMMLRRVEAHQPMALFTLNIQTGELKTFNHSTDWLNHVQFSPTDPSLLMFCHEGPWQMVDRIWTIHTDGTGLTLIHKRTMENEIAGHEFFSADGKWIWYDLQTPRGEDFWLGGYETATGRRLWYHLTRDEWSVHYNVSRDGSLFAGDGGDQSGVAHATNGKWIYLFRPENTPEQPNPDGLVQTGVFRAEPLVNLSKHHYHLEPNVNFSPDGKWIVFRSNMFGPAYVFAVEIIKSVSEK